MKFKLHGFHILDALNDNIKHVQRKPYEFLVIGDIEDYYDNKEVVLSAIIYDSNWKEYQSFNMRSHIIQPTSIVNPLFELFLDDIYINMVFSIETNGKVKSPLDGEVIYTFRDILMYIYKHDRLPHPVKDYDDVRNLPDALGNVNINIKQLQLINH